MPVISPGLILIVGALLVPLLPRVLKRPYILLLPLLSLAYVLGQDVGYSGSVEVFGGLFESRLRIDKLARVFAIIFHIAAFLSVLFALHLRKEERSDLQHTAGLMYAGSAIGALFAGDLLTLFVFWELTAITSVFLIWAQGTERAYRTGLRYLLIQVGSGVLLLAGIVFHYQQSGSLAFGHLGIETWGGKLIFLAFGIKAAFPFLHNWLQDAYPEATPTGTVWLSAFTTKLAIYALARGYAGTEILVPIGAAMTAFPIFYAVIENDLRRVLAYSLNNQLGFMVVGIGIGTELSLNGTAAHAFAHILYKGLLFMSMGAVIHRVGHARGSDLGKLYKIMPWTTAFCIVGAASISAFPLTSGFVSKSLILSGAAVEHYNTAWLILLFASAGVFHHSGIKIPFFAFFGRHDAKDEPGHVRPAKTPLNMLIAMGIASALCIGVGTFPGLLYDLLPYSVDYHPYTVGHVISQYQLLLFSGLAFAVLQRTGVYPPELRSVVVDFDWTYRKAIPRAVMATVAVGSVARQAVLLRAQGAVSSALAWVRRWHGPDALMARTWPAAATALMAAVLLGAYLVLYFS